MKFLCNFFKETCKLVLIATTIVAASTTVVYALMSNDSLMGNLSGTEKSVYEESVAKDQSYIPEESVHTLSEKEVIQYVQKCVEFLKKYGLLKEKPLPKTEEFPVTQPTITQPMSEPSTQLTVELESETEPEMVTESPTEPETETEPELETVIKTTVEPETEPETVTEPPTEPETEISTEPEPQYNVDGAMLEESEKIVENQWSTLQKTVELINVYRTENGLPELNIDRKLCLMACYRSEEQASQLYVSHQRIDGRDSFTIKEDFGYASSIFGEVCGQYQELPEEIVNDWMMSPGHAAILMNGQLTKIGIGVVAGSNGGLFWTGLLSG